MTISLKQSIQVLFHKFLSVMKAGVLRMNINRERD